MKRSEVNRIIKDFEKFLAKHKFNLPVWASWKPEEWKGESGDGALFCNRR